MTKAISEEEYENLVAVKDAAVAYYKDPLAPIKAIEQALRNGKFLTGTWEKK